MATTLMKIQGLDGTIELMNDRVVISRSGLLNSLKFGTNSRREIPVGMISEVLFRAPSLLTMGEIEFIRSGSNASTVNGKKVANLNLVKFNKKNVAEFEALKEKIFELINKQNRA